MKKVATKGRSRTVRLGLMSPLSGIVGLYGDEISMAGRIACDEVNEAGGVLGRRLELLIEDDGSLPPSSVTAAERLIDGHGCVAIIGNLLSNSRIAVAYQVAEPRRIPYLNFSFYEGSILSHYFFHFAALPNQQIERMIPYMRDRFGPRMFFAGHNYEWPRGSIDAAKRALEQSGGEVAGEEYCPIGVSREEIECLLDQVTASLADVFVPYFAGADQIKLLTRFTERGLKGKMAVVMGHYDEAMASILPPEVREGFYSSNTYFMTLDTRENRDYLARLSRQPGVNGIWPDGNGILTNFGEGAYLCVRAFAQAANQAGSLDAEALIAALEMIAVSGPQGVVQMDPVTHHARVNTCLSRCRADGAFEIIERFGAIAPMLPERYRHMRIVRQSQPADIHLQSRMMAQMTEAVFLVRAADGVIVYANQGTGRMFRYGEDELIGKGFPALLAPSGRSAEETVAFIGSMLSRKGVWEGEMETITGDGRRFWCASSGSVFTHPSHGEVWMLLGRDITEKKRAEAELKEYQEHLEELVKERTEELAHANAQLTTVLDNLTEGLVVADLKGTLFHWNPAAVRMHGFASEEEGKRRLAEFGKLFELSTEKDGILPVEKWPLARILKGEELRNWEVNVRRLDRDWSRVFNYGGTVARNNDGTPVLAVVTVADITERKQAEEELKKALHEKEVLLKEIHHRVKNNMQVISSLVSLQAESFEDEAVREVLNDVTSRVRSMALVHDKLYQSGDLAKIDFAEYARSLLSSLWCAYGSSMATIRLTLDLSPIFFSVDTAVPCGLILNELAGNALKHAFRGRLEGQVTVSLKSSDDGKICLCVADDGVGLPVELDWRKARSLGLCLVQMLAKQIGATVEVNGSGAGTRFQIALPFPG